MSDLTCMVLDGNSIEVLRTLEDNSVDSVVCDPPYEIGFMSKSWDSTGIAHSVELWRECLRVLKPGGYLLSFGGSRTYHRVACAIEDAGFEIRDQIMWLYGCLSADTEILVNGLWEPYSRAIEGSLALGYDKNANEFSWQRIERIFEYTIDDTAYRIESDSTDQIVSRNHRCLVEREGALVFELAEEAALQREARVPILENLPELLRALPLPHEGAGAAQEGVLVSMCAGSPTRPAPADEEAQERAEGAGGSVRGLRSVCDQTGVLAEEGQPPNLLPAMQRGVAGSRVGAARPQRSCSLDGAVEAGIKGTDDRRDESVLEGRRYLLQDPRELQGGQVCPVSPGIQAHGAEGWVCNGTSSDRSQADGTMPSENGGCAPHLAQPDRERPEQPDAVQDQPRAQTVRASRYTRTDLARITPFRYSGVVWCIQVSTGAFVARRNGKVFVTGNSGFPKSLNVGKAIDKAARGVPQGGADPTSANHGKFKSGCSEDNPEGRGFGAGPGQFMAEAGEKDSKELVIEAQQWDGWGTALKPAHEPIVVARKPLIGTVAANVLEWGTGAINVDGCRVGTEDSLSGGSGGLLSHIRDDKDYPYKNGYSPSALGRWPANFIHDGSDEVLEAFPDAPGQQGDLNETGRDRPGHGRFGKMAPPVAHAARIEGNKSAARFFYCAKVSKKERGEGNTWPTVKPIALMRYLCRLVTPPGGTVLDPFLGSGSTGLAARAEGFNFIGIDNDPGALQIARKRLEAA